VGVSKILGELETYLESTFADCGDEIVVDVRRTVVRGPAPWDLYVTIRDATEDQSVGIFARDLFWIYLGADEAGAPIFKQEWPMDTPDEDEKEFRLGVEKTLAESVKQILRHYDNYRFRV
jgi:hypothetical protein